MKEKKSNIGRILKILGYFAFFGGFLVLASSIVIYCLPKGLYSNWLYEMLSGKLMIRIVIGSIFSMVLGYLLVTKRNMFFNIVLIDCILMAIVLPVSISRLVHIISANNVNVDMFLQIFLLIVIVACATYSGVCDIIYCLHYLKGNEKKKLGTKIGFCFCIQAVLLAAIIIVVGF